MRRQLTNEGFAVREVALPEQVALTMDAVTELRLELAKLAANADDLGVVVGDCNAASLAIHATTGWCGGMPLAVVPTDALCMTRALVQATPLDAGDLPHAIETSGHARIGICDLDQMNLTEGEQARLARALFVQTAVADNQNGFAQLAERAVDIAEGKREAIADQIVDCSRARGRIMSASSVAVRQGLAYGTTFADTLVKLVPGTPYALALGEGMRFAARMAVALGNGDLDFVFEQDGMMGRLDLPEVACDLDADAFVEAMRQERFRYSMRFMLALPQAVGRIRLTSVSDDVLREHLGAWCASRKRLL
jgi:3-dehydroquinate synthase